MRGKRRKWQAVELSVSAACAVAVAFVWACLPNLGITEPSQPAPFCGDGIITPDAGEQCDPGPSPSPSVALGCSHCQVTCRSDAGTKSFFDPASNHCYFATDDTASIDAAAAVCEGNGGHVVRFVDESELVLVEGNAPTGPFWVDLREIGLGKEAWIPGEVTTEPGWSPECSGCFAQVDGGSDGGGIPPGVGVGGAMEIGTCVISSTDLSAPWEQSVCKGAGLLRPTICEREPTGTRTIACSYGACFTVAATTKRYVLYGSKETASGAVSICQTLGGQVAAFESPEEREQVGYEIGRQTVIDAGSDYWIGLGTDGGAWTWDGVGPGLQPLPWAQDQPSGDDAGLRAYVILQSGTVDSELALVAGAGETHFPLCQY